MIWAAPEFLWLLWLAPLAAAAAAWLRTGTPSAALECTDLSWLPPQRSLRLLLARWLPLGGTLLAAVLMLLALARPLWPEAASRLAVPARTIVFVLDVSGSMAEADFGAPPRRRLDAAADTLRRLIAARPDDALGLVTFAAQPEAIVPPTLSHAALLSTLAEASPLGGVPDNTTNLGDALAVALERARQAPGKDRALVVVSDGEHNVANDAIGPTLKPKQAAALARALGVRIHTLFLDGRPANDAEAQRLKQGATAMAEIAALAGGAACRADDEAGLQALQAALDRLEPALAPSFRYERFKELAPWSLGLALIVFLASWLLEETWLRILPARWR